MIVGIHQPNFIPWPGYFYKILESDIFVIIDQVQFVKGSICNRNKIKTTDGTSINITIPVKLSKGSYQAFNEIEIDYSQNWQSKILNIVRNHYQKAPYFEEYFSLFSEIINDKHQNLASLNIKLIKTICKKINIKTPIYIASELNYNFGKKNEMNLNIVKYFNGDIYFSGQGAKKYNDEKLFTKNNIAIKYVEFNPPKYPQLWGKFISNLSVIDLLFNVGENTLLYISENSNLMKQKD